MTELAVDKEEVAHCRGPTVVHRPLLIDWNIFCVPPVESSSQGFLHIYDVTGAIKVLEALLHVRERPLGVALGQRSINATDSAQNSEAVTLLG